MIIPSKGAGMPMNISSFGVSINPAVAVFIALTASLLTTLPITPAGLGAVEGTMTAAFVIVGFDNNLGGSIALVDRVISYWSIFAFGSIVWILSKKK